MEGEEIERVLNALLHFRSNLFFTDILNASFAPPVLTTDLDLTTLPYYVSLTLPNLPSVQPVTTQFRSISKIDKNSFKQDLAQSITPLTPITNFNRQLRCVLDKHAPLCHRTVRQRRPIPWFSSIAEQFHKLKRVRRRAERRWLKSKLTVHKQIYENI